MPGLIHPAPPAPTHATSLAPLVAAAGVLLVVLILGTIYIARR